MFWDFLSLRPETTHQVSFLFSGRGTPFSYRHMNGYGSHTFKMVNSSGEAVYCKFHFKVDDNLLWLLYNIHVWKLSVLCRLLAKYYFILSCVMYCEQCCGKHYSLTTLQFLVIQPSYHSYRSHLCRHLVLYRQNITVMVCCYCHAMLTCLSFV